MRPLLSVLLLAVRPAHALQLGGWFKPRFFNAGAVQKLEAELVRLAATPEVGATLRTFEALEAAAPAPPDLLRSSPALLDGRWSLLTTVAARVGEALPETGQMNVVNASGIAVEASKGTLPVQEIDVERGRIGNEILLAPLGQRIYLRVAGSFEPAQVATMQTSLIGRYFVHRPLVVESTSKIGSYYLHTPYACNQTSLGHRFLLVLYSCGFFLGQTNLGNGLLLLAQAPGGSILLSSAGRRDFAKANLRNGCLLLSQALGPILGSICLLLQSAGRRDFGITRTWELDPYHLDRPVPGRGESTIPNRIFSDPTLPCWAGHYAFRLPRQALV